MKPKLVIKILTDIGMTVILLLLMAYEMVGQAAHEWLGIAIFVLFVCHHILNFNWIKNMRKGHYTKIRVLQTVLVFLVLLSMIGSAVSGVILSRHALSFLPITGGRAFARNLHMLSAYWGFLFMALHLGFHVDMLMGIGKKFVKNPSNTGRKVCLGLSVLAAGYGVYAFFKREIGGYLFLRTQFVFFDFEEPLVFFLADYITIMILFVLIGHFLAKGAKK